MAPRDRDNFLQRWRQATTPLQLIHALPPGCSARKLRLAMVAALRRLSPLLLDERSRRAVATVERLADGLASDSERAACGAAALAAYEESRANGYDPAVANAAYCLTYVAPGNDARRAIEVVFEDCLMGCIRNRHLGYDPEEEQAAQCRLLRCIFGIPDPERLAQLSPAAASWRLANGGAAGYLARAIYEERRMDDLPVLADALEDAGCREADVLEHCRDDGLHVRGCWVVDLLLEKA